MSTRFSRVCVAAFLVLLSASAVSLMAQDRPDPPKVVEEIVAKINGDIVTRGDLEKARVQMDRDMKQAGMVGPAAKKQLDQAIQDELRNQIDSFLLVQKGKELDINVEADLNREIAGIQSASKITDPDKFHDMVRQETGLSYEDFRLKRKNALITERVISEEVWRNINIPEAEMQKYYDAHKSEFIRKESVGLRLILISTGDGKPETVAAAEKKAAGILARARGSSDKFADLARQYSDDPSAADDGLLPTAFERGEGSDPAKQLNKAIEDVVFAHEKGYVTDLIQIRGAGFAIYRVEDHIPAGQASFDDVKGQINNILTRPIADPKLREFLTKLRQNAFLQIKAGYIDSGAAPGKDTSWKDPTQLAPETTTKAAVANQRHLKKILGLIPYGYTGGEKDIGPGGTVSNDAGTTGAAYNQCGWNAALTKTMKSPAVRDLKPDEIANAVFLVQSKEIRQKRTGEPYLSLSLSDKTGEIEARMWDNVAEIMDTFERDDFIKVRGQLQIYNSRPQFIVHKLRKMEDAEVDFADFFPASARDAGEMWAELRAMVAEIPDRRLGQLLDAFLDDPEIAGRYRIAPAAKTIHHAFRAGLLEHVLSLSALARPIAKHYGVDWSLMVAGIVLHDIGKIYELTYERGFAYSTEGQLLGHIAIAMRMLSDKLRAFPDFPNDLRVLLEHMILSHHGKLEFGSPKIPLFPEALLLHYLDDMDSKMECMRATAEKGAMAEGLFTAWSSPLERVVLRKDRYLANGAAPTPAAKPIEAPVNPVLAPTGAVFGDKLRAALISDDRSHENG